MKNLFTTSQRFLVGCFSLLCLSATFAQSTKVVGELSTARLATVNGMSAISGLTVFNQNRIKTAPRGVAIIGLGKRGRIEVGADTDLTLFLSASNVGGELRNGRTLLSAPAGVSLTVNTQQGVIVTDGKRPAIISVETGLERQVVTAFQGEAKIVSGGKTEIIKAGEEVASTPRSGDWRHRVIAIAGLSGAGTAAGLSQVAGQAVKTTATVSPQAATAANLFNASVNYSLTRLTVSYRDPRVFFDTTITCRDLDNLFCHRRSEVRY